jgi:hypothetical protein
MSADELRLTAAYYAVQASAETDPEKAGMSRRLEKAWLAVACNEERIEEVSPFIDEIRAFLDQGNVLI